MSSQIHISFAIAHFISVQLAHFCSAFTMRFRHFIFAIAAIVAVKSEDLFTSPELSDDMLLPPLDISNDLDDSFLDNNNDLFVDSSDPNTLNSFELTASCPSNDGQHPARLRGRDEVCTPNSQPSLDGFINMLGTFGNPSQREKKLEDAASSAKVDEQDPCPAARPYHLCCEGFGRKLSAPPYGGIIRYLHRTMDNCEPGKLKMFRLGVDPASSKY